MDFILNTCNSAVKIVLRLANRIFWKVGMIYSYNKSVKNINKTIKRYEFNKEKRGCCICFEKYGKGEIIEICERCNMIYHKECLYKWLNVDLSCPNCRKFIVKKN